MKSGSDNFRDSAVQDIISELVQSGKNVILYEPNFHENRFHEVRVCKDLKEFKKDCDLILANRYASELADVKDKVFSRDIFFNN